MGVLQGRGLVYDAKDHHVFIQKLWYTCFAGYRACI